MMKRMSGWLGAAMMTVGLAAVAVGCGDDNTKKGPDGLSGDAIFSDVGNVDTLQGGDSSAAVKLLEFQQTTGDDGNACRGQPRCTIVVTYSSVKTLKVVYTEDGVPVAGQAVRFKVNKPAVGWIGALSAPTDPQGVVSMNTKSLVQVPDQFEVRAYIDGVGEKFFDVVVSPKGIVPLTVIGTYNGTRPVSAYSVSLYKQNGAGQPNCSDLNDLYENKTADTLRDNIVLGQSAKFPDFDNLEQDRTQKYTVLAVTKNANDKVQAWACDAQNAVVEWGKTKTVQLTLQDRPPLYAGAYDVISTFDFVSAIPQPYRQYVEYVVGFFQSPTTTILDITCDFLAPSMSSLQSFCDLLFDENDNPKPLMAFVSDILDSVIRGLTQNTAFGRVFQVGGDVADILKQFEIQATLTFRNEPDADGRFATGDTLENWHTVKVRWTLGANCDPATEVGCGVRQFSTTTFQSAAITGNFPASVANFYDLTIGQHPLNLKYGALLNYFMESLLIPLLVNNETVNSYEELLGMLMGGGAACLNPRPGELSCCERFGDGVGDKNGALNSAVENTVSSACNALVTAGPNFLRGALQNLDLSTGETFNLGTKVACRLKDSDDDMIIDRIGSPAAPCQWNVVLKFSDNAQTTIDATFWGARQE